MSTTVLNSKIWVLTTFFPVRQDNFKLDNFVNFSSFSTPPPNLEDGEEIEVEGEDFLAEKIGTLLHNGLYLNLRDKVSMFMTSGP